MEYKVNINENSVENTLFFFDSSKEGYYNSTDKEFYEDSAYTSSKKMTKVSGKVYKDIPTHDYYSCDGSEYKLSEYEYEYQFISNDNFEELESNVSSAVMTTELYNSEISSIVENFEKHGTSSSHDGFYDNGKFYSDRQCSTELTPINNHYYFNISTKESSQDIGYNKIYLCEYSFDYVGYVDSATTPTKFYKNEAKTIELKKEINKVYKDITTSSSPKYYTYNLDDNVFEETIENYRYVEVKSLSSYLINYVTNNKISKVVPDGVIIKADKLNGYVPVEFVTGYYFNNKFYKYYTVNYEGYPDNTTTPTKFYSDSAKTIELEKIDGKIYKDITTPSSPKYYKYDSSESKFKTTNPYSEEITGENGKYYYDIPSKKDYKCSVSGETTTYTEQSSYDGWVLNNNGVIDNFATKSKLDELNELYEKLEPYKAEYVELLSKYNSLKTEYEKYVSLYPSKNSEILNLIHYSEDLLSKNNEIKNKL